MMQHVQPCAFCSGIVVVHENHWKCTLCNAEWTLGMRLIHEGDKLSAEIDDVFGPAEERPPSLCVDTLYQYAAPNTTRGRCRLRIYRHDGRDVVLLTELSNNPGMSITNACAEVVTAVAATYALDETAIFIEHYLHAVPTYDLIVLQWGGGVAVNPEWRRLAVEEVERLTGAFLGDEAQRAATEVAWIDES